MRSIVSLILLVASTGAWAQPCPLRLPFRINVSISGRYANYQESDDTLSKQSHDTSNAMHTYSLTIDTTKSTARFSYQGGLLDYYDSVSEYGYFDTVIEVKVQFDSTGTTITSIACGISSYQWRCCNFNDWDFWSIVVENLKCQSDSILPLASQVIHEIDDSSYYVYQVDVGPPFHSYLSGFHLLTGTAAISGSSLSKASVNQKTDPQGFVFRSRTGAIECSFTPSQHSRALELYTPLGVRAAAHSVTPGETSAILPRLPAGLYFIRLEGALVKILLPE